MEHREIDFIARRYRHGRFAVEPALRRIVPASGRWSTRMRVAATVAVVVVMSAAAALIINNNYSISSDPVTGEVEQTAPAQTPETIVRVIDFEETPLPVVIDKIKEVYGVEITGIPKNAADYTLSLHYEGSAVDLITTINDILDTEMEVKK